tara:strand:- start:4613 stop:8098 length:3486 start_codon:yes stop_codon:yes gene_type:complete
MSEIKISLIEQSRIATPQPGELRIFADADNFGHLSTKDAQGHIEDLTEKGGNGFRSDQIIGGGEDTSLGVYEVKMTLETEDLLNMNWLGGLNPDGGIKMLDAAGEGKCNLLLFGASATWIAGESEVDNSSEIKRIQEEIALREKLVEALKAQKAAASELLKETSAKESKEVLEAKKTIADQEVVILKSRISSQESLELDKKEDSNNEAKGDGNSYELNGDTKGDDKDGGNVEKEIIGDKKESDNINGELKEGDADNGDTPCEELIASLEKQIAELSNELKHSKEIRAQKHKEYLVKLGNLTAVKTYITDLINWYNNLAAGNPDYNDYTNYGAFISTDQDVVTKYVGLINQVINGTGLESEWTTLSDYLTRKDTSIIEAIEALSGFDGNLNKAIANCKELEKVELENYNKSYTTLNNKLIILIAQLKKVKADCEEDNDDDDDDTNYDDDIDLYNKEIADLQKTLNGLFGEGTMVNCSGLVSEPYGEGRWLNIYYKIPGHNGEWSTETVMNIPLLREPYSTWTGKSRNEKRAHIVKGMNQKLYFGEGEQLGLYDKREPLNIDQPIDAQIWQPLLQDNGSGISHHSSENSEMWIGINGDLKSGHVGKEMPSCGKIIITAYYGVFNLKEANPTRIPKTQQMPTLNNPYATWLPKEVGGGMIMDGPDFMDVHWMKPQMHEMDNWLGYRGSANENDGTQNYYMSLRNSYVETQNEYQIELATRSNGQRIPDARQQLADRINVSDHPLPWFLNRGTFKQPTYLGTDATNFGWQYRVDEWSSIMWKYEDPDLEKQDWIYDSKYTPVATKLNERKRAIEIEDNVTYLEQVGKITSISITTPGQGYNVGDVVHINPCDERGESNSLNWIWSKLSDGNSNPYEDPMKVGNGCSAVVEQVDANGGILKVNIIQNQTHDKNTGWFGGFLYDETATATAGMGMPNDANLQKVLAELLKSVESEYQNTLATFTNIKNVQDNLSSTKQQQNNDTAELARNQSYLAILLLMDPVDADLVKQTQDTIANLEANLIAFGQAITKLETQLDALLKQSEEEGVDLQTAQSTLNKWLSENQGIVAEFSVTVEYSDCWVPDENNMQLNELNGYPGIYPITVKNRASFPEVFEVKGRTSLSYLEEVRIANRDGHLKNSNEVCLNSIPVCWSNCYLPEFQIKKYKL